MDVFDPTIPDVANFLNYLFKEKNLKPSTIAGYRTAIADGLDLKGEEFSKSLELNRLLASFYRDKPVANRFIPSWDLALVFHALTKQPLNLWREGGLMAWLRLLHNLKIASLRWPLGWMAPTNNYC